MPIEDDINQAMREGQLGPDHIIVMNPADFNQVRRELTADVSGTPSSPTFFGSEVFRNPRQARGSIQILARSSLTAVPRMVVHPSNVGALQRIAVRDLVDMQYIVPSGTFQRPIRIPTSEIWSDPVANVPPRPKSLWELLDEDEE